MVFEWMGATIAWRIWTAFKSARVHIPVYLCAVCEVYALCVCVCVFWDRYYRMKSHARSLHADGDDRTIVVRGGMGTTNEG